MTKREERGNRAGEWDGRRKPIEDCIEKVI
jgi:hypothetical protein